MNTLIKCSVCEQDINTDEDGYYIGSNSGRDYCDNCYCEHVNSASTVLLFGPDYISDEEPVKVLVTDDFALDGLYLEDWTDLQFAQRYVATSGWRGYTETKINGWTEVVDGWTTGWPDETVRRKIDFNEWVEALVSNEIVPPVNVAVISDPTSNVFSTAIGVHVADDQVTTFLDWMNGELENLRYALT